MNGGSRFATVVGLIALALPASAHAADYRISDTSDGAPAPADCSTGTAMPDTNCSLRDAVAAAEATAEADRIFLDPGTPYQLAGAVGEDLNASGDIDLMTNAGATGGLEIGTTQTFQTTAVVRAAANDRIFDMRGGNTQTFSLSNIIIENGNVTGTGGAIRAVGSGGNLILSGATVRNSRATQNGGAIDFTGLGGAAGARLVLIGAVISGNANGTGDSGAAIQSNRETQILSNSAIFGNGKDGALGTPALGGGVLLSGYGGLAPDRSRIDHSSIHDNRALAGAGVAAIQGHRLTVTNSAIGENVAGEDGAVSVGDPNTSVFLENVTLANNVSESATATNPASIQVYAGADATNVTARNTIIATNDAVNDNCNNAAGGGAFTSLGNNIQFGRPGDPACAVAPQPSDRTVNPLLPATGTPTMQTGMFFYLPAAGSPAIDTGNACEANTGSTQDQLLQSRTQGAACDVGAVEQANPPVTNTPTPGTAVTPNTTPVTGQRAAALKKCKKKRTKQARKRCRKRAQQLPV